MQHAQPHATLDPFQQVWPPVQAPHGSPMPLQLAPMAAPPVARTGSAPVTGGGAAATATRLRWGRLGLVAAGIAIVGVAIWSAQATAPAPKAGSATSGARDVGGSLTPLADTAGAGGAEAKDAGARDTDAAAADAGSDTTAAATDAASSVPATDAPAMADTAAAATSVPAAAATPVTGGGGPSPTAGSGELPYTGAETWIAAILGVLVLGLGICVQVNAVRIGMTAMLYRRGILLRPIDCARLANERGFGSLRVAISNGLHRLLAEPEGNDFVRARHA